jgi:hypothetical protein
MGSTDAGANRVYRGGGWNYDAQYVLAAYRNWVNPGYRNDYLGFRCRVQIHTSNEQSKTCRIRRSGAESVRHGSRSESALCYTPL